MNKYEFVAKKEYSPLNEKIKKNIIQKIKKELKMNGITFQLHLVGSAKNNIVTRIIGNENFDFDYQLQIEKNKKDYSPKEIREMVINSLKKNSYLHIDDNHTHSIRVKSNEINLKFNADFVITKVNEKTNILNILTKKDDTFKWEECENLQRVDKKLLDLKNKYPTMYFTMVRDEYLKLKENNKDLEKHSFELYFEAVNNVYDQYI